jgi:hypothetical protein
VCIYYLKFIFKYEKVWPWYPCSHSQTAKYYVLPAPSCFLKILATDFGSTMKQYFALRPSHLSHWSGKKKTSWTTVRSKISGHNFKEAQEHGGAGSIRYFAFLNQQLVLATMYSLSDPLFLYSDASPSKVVVVCRSLVGFLFISHNSSSRFPSPHSTLPHPLSLDGSTSSSPTPPAMWSF